MRPWLNWIEHLTTDQKVEGSNPSGRARIKTTPQNCGVVFIMCRAPGFEPEPGVRQQVDLPNDSFGKSSRLPRSRHTVPCEGILLGAPEIQPPCKRRFNFCIFHCGANLSLSLRRSTINVENVDVRLWQSRSICLRAIRPHSPVIPAPGAPTNTNVFVGWTRRE